MLLLVAVPVAVLTALLHPRPPQWEEETLKPGEVQLQMALAWKNVVWLDARNRIEYEQDHIPGALLLNQDEWDLLFFEFLGTWDPDQKVIVYCGGKRCQLSTQVAERLREELGSENIFVLKGGWSAWRNRGGS